MARRKKEGVFLNCFIERDIMDKLDNYCNVSRRTKTSIVEDALLAYIAVHSNNGIYKPEDSNRMTNGGL